MTIKGSLLLIIPIVKRFSREDFLISVETGTINGNFSQRKGQNINF